MKLTVLTADDKIVEIRRLYFSTTRQSIASDLARAVQLLMSMNTEEERERAAVFMDGLAQMRSDWARADKGRKPGGKATSPAANTRAPVRPNGSSRRRSRGSGR
jgi:hypothetical protein